MPLVVNTNGLRGVARIGILFDCGLDSLGVNGRVARHAQSCSPRSVWHDKKERAMVFGLVGGMGRWVGGFGNGASLT
jgi:hypothetical protein